MRKELWLMLRKILKPTSEGKNITFFINSLEDIGSTASKPSKSPPQKHSLPKMMLNKITILPDLKPAISLSVIIILVISSIYFAELELPNRHNLSGNQYLVSRQKISPEKVRQPNKKLYLFL